MVTMAINTIKLWHGHLVQITTKNPQLSKLNSNTHKSIEMSNNSQNQSLKSTEANIGTSAKIPKDLHHLMSLVLAH
jgi:FtsZ-binding cell division protein ZapB